MNLLVYEHITGGGYADGKIAPSILCEGYAMLRTLTLDLKAVGHNVTTFLDSRLKTFNPLIEADNIVSISSPDDLNKALEKFSQAADGVYIVAPESGQVLQKLVETVEASGGISLNCRIKAIEKASNKMTTYEILKKNRVRVPETLMIDLYENVKQIEHRVRDLGFPLVFKPLDGVGCCGLSVVKEESHIAAATNKIVKETSNKYFIAQRLIRGIAASVSLTSTDDEALPITLNKQMITLSQPRSDSRYNGGIVPLHHPSEAEALRIAKTAVKSLTGLRGYVGVDIVLTSNGPVVMEVNPRLTTSYVGLRRVLNFNPAQAMVDAVLERKLPKNVRTSGYAFFLKAAVPALTHETIVKTYRLNGVLSPPFPITESKMTYALLASYSAKFRDAKMELYKAKKSLLSILSVGD